MSDPRRATEVGSRMAVVSGATGLIGSRLVPAFAASGFTVRRLVRRQPSNANEFRWDPAGGTIDAAALDECFNLEHPLRHVHKILERPRGPAPRQPEGYSK